MTSPHLMRQAIEALRLARTAIEPLTGAQIKLHRIDMRTADKIDATLSHLTEELKRMEGEDAARVTGTSPDECGTCRKALPEGCKTEFQGNADCALTYGVSRRDHQDSPAHTPMPSGTPTLPMSGNEVKSDGR